MRPAGRKTWRAARRALRDQRGVSTIEFIIVFPAVMILFFAYIELGTFATRIVMLERGLDFAVRDIRLGAVPPGLTPEQTHDVIKSTVCEHAFLLYSCSDQLLVEMTAVPLGADLPNTSTECRDKTGEVEPVIRINLGDRATADSQLMLVRACVNVNAIFAGQFFFPGVTIGDEDGYQLQAMSAFLNEPE